MSGLGSRAALIEELRVAGEEAARLTEMISLLRSAPRMEGARIGELTFEWKVAQGRTIALAAELREFEQRDATAAGDPDVPQTRDGDQEV